MHASAPPAAADLRFERGYPTPEIASQARDDSDFIRAVAAYRFFYPTVSGSAIFKGNAKLGLLPNRVFGMLDSQPRHMGFTLNSDTPYAPILLDLTEGPIMVELAPGPLIVMAMDIHQNWVADMGLPGPDQGKGGKHLLLPPGYRDAVPAGCYPATSTSYRMLVGARSLPVEGDVPGAMERIKTIKVHPLKPRSDWKEPDWLDLTPMPQDTTPLAWEKSLQFWRELHEVIDTEPPYAPFQNASGDLAALGIAKGRPFAPDARMKHILEEAALAGNAEMRVESFADRRPDRMVWSDRKWEWASLRFENAGFFTPGYTDLEARDKWFFQAIGASPAMFRRSAGAGSVYWLGLRDNQGAYLDGAKTYRLSVPQPVPGKLFWSVTVYDSDTRSQLQTDQGKAALRSLFELKDLPASAPAELYFGPSAPSGKAGQWIKTIPGKGWFVYMRVYGPEEAAFNGSWKPGDFEAVSKDV